MGSNQQSFFSVFEKMGGMGQFVSLLIFILSVVAIYIFVKRLIVLNKKYDDRSLLRDVLESVSSGDINSAKDYCIRSQSPLSRVLYKGVSRLGLPLKDIELAMEKEIDIEYFALEKGQNVLSLVAKLAPMLGFIGTIAGVIQIFYTINTTGDYNIESISGGLYVKMITSALGLSLGIIAYFFYFIISSKIKDQLFVLEKGTSDFIDNITSPAKH